MSPSNFQFGRNNIGYAVIAIQLNNPSEQVVVSLHLGEKNAHNHRLQMQSRSSQIKFVVRRVKIGGVEVLDEDNRPLALSATMQNEWQELLGQAAGPERSPAPARDDPDADSH